MLILLNCAGLGPVLGLYFKNFSGSGRVRAYILEICRARAKSLSSRVGLGLEIEAHAVLCNSIGVNELSILKGMGNHRGGS